MRIVELRQLVEADTHVLVAHQCIRHQRQIVAGLRRAGKTAHSASALLSLMALTVPIVEDLRQQTLTLVSAGR